MDPFASAAAPPDADPRLKSPWPALWAMVIGFFMIMIDATIVTIALPTIISDLGTDLTGAMWVTSGYLLAYLVPLLITGRLGDRFGPKQVYLAGLAIFSLASLACGLSGSIETLIAARVVQGLGAACVSPQTMTVITRLFPGRSRAPAMAIWGATAGVASLVGPILGGFLVDTAGWPWIFFINLPIGLAGAFIAGRFVPRFPLTTHRIDWLGGLLSAAAIFALVFAIQEGGRYSWGTITENLVIATRPTGLTITVLGLLITGGVLLVVFIAWEMITPGEPLIPMRLFADRNFSLSSAAVCAQGFGVAGALLPVILYLQNVRALSPTTAALMLAPVAITSLAMAQPVGQRLKQAQPKWLAITGFAVSIAAAGWFTGTMHADLPLIRLIIPLALVGLSGSLIWPSVALTATYNLPPSDIGAGSGVYNAMRQVGSVLGAAAITSAMESRIAWHLPEATGSTAAGLLLPDELREPFTRAMADSILVPALASAVGLVVVAFFVRLPRLSAQEPAEPGTPE